MSILKNLALGVEIMLLKRIFAMSRSAVGVLTSPGHVNVMQFLLTVILVLFSSCSPGVTSHTICVEVMSFFLSMSTLCGMMKKRMLVP